MQAVIDFTRSRHVSGDFELIIPVDAWHTFGLYVTSNNSGVNMFRILDLELEPAGGIEHSIC